MAQYAMRDKDGESATCLTEAGIQPDAAVIIKLSFRVFYEAFDMATTVQYLEKAVRMNHMIFRFS